jgi:membrane protein involved in colicin uptake
MAQALYLVNSDEFQAKVVNSPRMRKLLEQKKSDAEVVEELYLATLSRLPTEKESQRILDYVWGDNKAAFERASAEGKTAAEALAKLKEILAKATMSAEAAEKAAKEAEAKAKAQALGREAGKPAELKKKAADEAAAQRQVANQAKTKRDQLVAEEKAAAAKLAEAGKKVEAAKTAHQNQRVPALQDVLWTLLNTKEFLCNH